MRVVLHSRSGVLCFAALAEGCQAAGHTVVWQRPGLWKRADMDLKADAVVVHGVQGRAGEIHAAYRARGVPVWIMELPRLREEEGALGFYLNTVHYLPATGFREAVTPGLLTGRRPEAALVAGQVPNDIAHGMPAQAWDRWARETIAMAREKTGLPVIYRQHPLYDAPIPDDGYGADDLSDSRSEPIRAALERAAVLVCHNSTAGYDAIDAGVPVFATATGVNAPGYQRYTLESLESLEQLDPRAREECLSRVASTQWTIPEFRDGRAAECCFGESLSMAVA